MNRYKERWGDMDVPRRFWEDWALGIWVSDVRAAIRQQWLNPTQTRSMQDMHFPFKTSVVSKPFGQRRTCMSAVHDARVLETAYLPLGM